MDALALFARGPWLDANQLRNEKLLDCYTVNGLFPGKISAN